ncbi:MAG TPA: MaoC family dehydratase [Dysgonomonas sp.]|uniref:MaoC family dehydratase n=1 Tax=unclassified Dysgonomonas TaxID=2630389 RepID=UPI0025C31603|nr:MULTISPECIES: MaoC family dehydratase [unclassified Dysgonomonas]HML65191.1 MaoC family dehydratase [Dysgonomonas sp.]
MNRVIINSYQDFEQYVGKEIGMSDYLQITQDRINMFADATLDHQWIHCDAERAKTESPYESTIAHGYLLISVLPYLWDQIVKVNNIKMMVNYGIEKLKYGQPVKVDSEIRIKVKLNSLTNLRGITKAEMKAVMEIKNTSKPAFEATFIFLYYFNN